MSAGGDRQELLTADRQARRAAQSEFEAPLVLEAGAGTGKTTTLIARVLSWCLGPGWERAAGELAPAGSTEAPDLDRIAARTLEGVDLITFTEAAAAQMESRLAAALARIAAGDGAVTGLDPEAGPLPPRGEAARRARALLAAFDHVTARTIHAYCLNLLSRFPLEAGVHPSLAVDADGRLVEELVHEVVETGLRHAYREGVEGPLIELARRGIGPRRIAEALHSIVVHGLSSEQLAEEPFGAERVEAMSERLGRLSARLLDAMGEEVRALGGNQLAPRIAAAASATIGHLEERGEDGLASAAILVSRLDERWPKNYLDKLKGWRRGKLSAAEDRAFGDSADEVGTVAGELRRLIRHYLRLDPRLLDAGRRALHELLVEVERQMRERGIITFDGLLLEARELLRRRPEVRAREQRRLRQLLVDEFQDTDRLQCDIVRYLTLEAPAARRPGLFVVGDPKQSIFGWRDADLEAYESFLAGVREAGGKRHLLVENFRSSAPLLAEVDRVIPQVMRERPGLQPRYEPLVACEELRDSPGFSGAGRTVVEHWVSWAHPESEEAAGARTHAETAVRLEAEAVARDVAELHHAAGVPWSDFALLLRAASRLDTFLEAFRAAGVPFAVTRDRSYYQRREVIEAAALVRAVVNPVDHLALVTFLRSSAVGVPDAAWIPLWRHRFPDLMSDLVGFEPALLERIRGAVAAAVAEIPDDVPGIERIRGWEKNLLTAIDRLARLRTSFATEPPDRFVERLRAWLLPEALAAARYLGAFRVANLERFLRQLLVSIETLGGDVQAVLRGLRRSVAEARQAEEALPKDAAEDAVQVLTIHSAKGLEFPHVYLAQLHVESGGGREPEIDVDEHWAPGAPLEYKLFKLPTPAFDRVLERRRQVELAERIRLLYVAMTRATRRLVLIGKWPARPEPMPEDEVKTHMDLLSSRTPLPPSIEALAEAARERSEPAVDEAATRWRFPAYARPAEPAATETPGGERPPTADEVREAGERLRAQSRAAAELMRRPFSAAASQEAAERLRELASETAGTAAGGRGRREVALQVGTAIHRLFESWELDAEPEAELARCGEEVEVWLRAAVAPELLDDALHRARQLLGRLGRGRLLARFLELGPRIVARELPIAAPPPDGATGPVAFVSGAVDLVYRRRDGTLAIVDFKTDEVELEVEIEARAESYRPQEAIYARALETALDLPRPPACELWFLWPDRLWESAGGDRRPAPDERG